MWLPAALTASAAGAGVLAAVLACFAVVERDDRSRGWGFWSSAFALAAGWSAALLVGPAGSGSPVPAATVLATGCSGLMALGILQWTGAQGLVRPLAAGAGAVVLWAVAGLQAGLPGPVIHLPADLYAISALGAAAWVLWSGRSPAGRLTAAMILVLAVQAGSATLTGWDGRTDGTAAVAFQAWSGVLVLVLITAALRDRAVRARAAAVEAVRAKAEADAASRRLMDFAGISSDWFWEQDADLRFVYMSPSIAQFSGLSPADHYGKTRRETGPAGVTEAQWAAHENALQARAPFRDFRFFRDGVRGERRCLSVSGVPVFDDAGAFRGYRGIGRDVTDLVRAEQRASTINGRLVQALDARSEGLAFWDADDRLLLCNQAYRDQAGAARSALVPGVTFDTFLRAGVAAGEVPAAAGREEAWVEERMRLRRDLPYTVEVFRGDRWLLVREQRTPDGGALLTATDITELKRREDALVAAVTDAQLANRAKMAFLATMSHELRTPLNAIIGFAEVIESGQIAPNGDVQTEYAGYIRESGAHLLSVINDLLDVSRIEAGRMSLDEKPFTLARLFAECDRMIRRNAEIAGLSLTVSPVDGNLALLGDRRALKQVLINLLSNAVKFTERNGAIELSADRDASGALRLVVGDTGIGVEGDRLGELFEPFRQLENVHARRHHGTGLGLYISKSLVEAHGGTIRFESAVGRGSTVTITLPADRVIDTVDAVVRRIAV